MPTETQKPTPREVVLLLLVVFLLMVLMVFAVIAERAKVSQGRVVVYYEGQNTTSVWINTDDILQLLPFTFPTTPEFLNAHVKVEQESEEFLVCIGQIPTSTGEGRSGNSVFFLGKKPTGKTIVKVKCTLVDDDDKPIKGYYVSYRVQVASK